MIKLEEHEKKPFMLSGAVVILSLIAIIVFFVIGAGVLFYLIALVAIVLGIYLAYHISDFSKASNSIQIGRRKAGRTK